MTKRTCQFPKHTCLREINFLKIAGISLLLFCTTSQIAVADSYEKNAVTATQQSKTEKCDAVPGILSGNRFFYRKTRGKN